MQTINTETLMEQVISEFRGFTENLDKIFGRVDTLAKKIEKQDLSIERIEDQLERLETRIHRMERQLERADTNQSDFFEGLRSIDKAIERIEDNNIIYLSALYEENDRLQELAKTTNNYADRLVDA